MRLVGCDQAGGATADTSAVAAGNGSADWAVAVREAQARADEAEQRFLESFVRASRHR
jgi:hypothetical protein